jgi:uncharacterized membrane protein
LRIRLGSGLLILNILSIVLVLVISFVPTNIVRIILGLPFVLFFPGYALMAALFPNREGMIGIERVALSFGLSIAVVPLVGLLLNFVWAVRLEPMLYSVALFVFTMSGIAWLRRRRLPESKRFSIEFPVRVLALGGGIWRGGAWNRAVSVILMLAILGALGTLGYVIAMPRVGERFTEFYVLGPDGKATSYVTELRVGERGRVIVGIVNHEYETARYRLELRIDGVKNNEVNGITLEHEGKWENEVSFTPQVAGENRKVEFLLYKDGEVKPCFEPLQLWVDVKN